MFDVRNISKHFGGVKALSDVSFSLAPGRILACVGPNAAGKTTLLNIVSGWHRPDEGSVSIDQQEIVSFDPEAFALHGVVRTFQRARLFKRQTVIENLLLASRLKSEETILAAMFRTVWWRRQKKESERAHEILEALGIAGLADRPARELSGGEQRLAELAVAAMRRPKILILDEPLANLSQESRTKVTQFLLKQKRVGVCCILVEHDLAFVQKIADDILVLSGGAMLGVSKASGSSAQGLIERAYSVTHSGPVARVTKRHPSLNGRKDPKDSGSASDLSRTIAHRVPISEPPSMAARSAYESLTVRGLSVNYGGGPVVQDLNLEVRPGEIVALVGGNGAGKSTTMRAILGLIKYQGSVCLGKRSLTSVQPYVISRLGISYVSQHRKVFPSLTVLENLLIASHSNKQVAEDRLQPALEAFPELSVLLGVRGGTLSGGQQQMVAIARALLQKPRLLLLDEPSAGLSEVLWNRLVDVLTALARNNMPILIVEHRLGSWNHIRGRSYLIESGKIVAVGDLNGIPSNIVGGLPSKQLPATRT